MGIISFSAILYHYSTILYCSSTVLYPNQIKQILYFSSLNKTKAGLKQAFFLIIQHSTQGPATAAIATAIATIVAAVIATVIAAFIAAAIAAVV